MAEKIFAETTTQANLDERVLFLLHKELLEQLFVRGAVMSTRPVITTVVSVKQHEYTWFHHRIECEVV